MNKKIAFLLFGLCAVGILFFLHYRNAPSPINWADTVSQETLNDSWAILSTYFSQYNPLITYDEFLLAIKNGEYQTLSVDAFLGLNVKNHHKIDYRDAKIGYLKAHGAAFPFHQEKDIQIVQYFLKITLPVSPGIIARIHEKDCIRYVQLDGIYRIVAALMKGSPIKVLFIDL